MWLFVILFHVCVWKESVCVIKMLCGVSENVETMCDVKTTCQKSVFPLQWSLEMRWCHQSSIDVIKKNVIVPSLAKVKTHTEVKLWLVQSKTMILVTSVFGVINTYLCVFGDQLNGSHGEVKAIPRWDFRGFKSLCSRVGIWFDWLGLGLVEPCEKEEEEK